MSFKHGIATLGVIAVGAGLAGCGSSGKAPGVILVPGGGSTVASATAAATTSTPKTSTTAVTTPKSGPLSAEPVFSVPSGKAPTKLVSKDLVKGTGATAEKGDTVWVNYVGKLYSNGKVFDSSWSRGQTFSFKVGQGVIEGWSQGIVGMKVDGRRELIIPPSLAYKNQPTGSIPKNSTLVFVIDLLKVTK